MSTEKLTPEAADFLSIIHASDTLKILRQVEVLNKEHKKSPQLQALSEMEYYNLIYLLQKYYDMLKKITKPTTE